MYCLRLFIVVNPRRACAARVTVLGLSFRMSVGPFFTVLLLVVASR